MPALVRLVARAGEPGACLRERRIAGQCRIVAITDSHAPKYACGS